MSLLDALNIEVANSRRLESINRNLVKQHLRDESELVRNETLIEDLKEVIDSLQKEISKVKTHLYQVQKENQEKDKNIAECEKIIGDLEERIIKLRERIRVITSRRIISPDKIMNSTIDELLRSLGDILNTFESYFSHDIILNQKELENTLSRLRDYIDAIVNRYYENVSALNRCKDRRARDESQIRQLNAYKERAERAEQENVHLKDENRKFNEKIMENNGWKEKYSKLYTTHGDLERENKKYVRRIYDLEDDNARIKKRYVDGGVRNRTLQRDLESCRADKNMVEYWRDELENRYKKWKRKSHYYRNRHNKWKNRFRNFYFQQNNNPLNNNMAEHRRLPTMKWITSMLNPISAYTGQMNPDDYFDMIIQAWAPAIPNMNALEQANAGDFNDTVKCEIIKGKMAGKFKPVPAQNNFVNPPVNIDTPDSLRAWVRFKYQQEYIGTQDSAYISFTQEKFQLNDTPESYENRIRPYLMGIPNGDSRTLSILKSQLPKDLFTWMRTDNPAGINEFFTALKQMHLERPSNSYGEQSSQSVHMQPVVHSQPIQNQANADQISALSDAYKLLEDKYVKLQQSIAKISQNPETPATADPIDELTREFKELKINLANVNQEIHAVRKATRHHCSKCHTVGHNSRSCLKRYKKTKRRRKVNPARIRSDSESEDSSTESDFNSDYGSDSEDSATEMNVNITRTKKN